MENRLWKNAGPGEPAEPAIGFMGLSRRFAAFSREIADRYTVWENYPWSGAMMQFLQAEERGEAQEKTEQTSFFITVELLKVYLEKQEQEKMGEQHREPDPELSHRIEEQLRLLQDRYDRCFGILDRLFREGKQMPEDELRRIWAAVEREMDVRERRWESAGTRESAETKKKPRVLESAGAKEKPGVLESAGEREKPGTLESAGEREKSGALEGVEEREKSRALESAGEREKPGVLESVGTKEKFGALKSAGEREKSGALEGVEEREKSGALEGVGTREKPGGLESAGTREKSGDQERTGGSAQRKPSDRRRIRPLSIGNPWIRLRTLTESHSHIPDGRERFQNSVRRQQQEYYAGIVRNYVVQETSLQAERSLGRELVPSERQAIQRYADGLERSQLIFYADSQDTRPYEEMAAVILKELRTQEIGQKEERSSNEKELLEQRKMLRLLAEYVGEQKTAEEEGDIAGREAFAGNGLSVGRELFSENGLNPEDSRAGGDMLVGVPLLYREEQNYIEETEKFLALLSEQRPGEVLKKASNHAATEHGEEDRQKTDIPSLTDRMESIGGKNGAAMEVPKGMKKKRPPRVFVEQNEKSGPSDEEMHTGASGAFYGIESDTFFKVSAQNAEMLSGRFLDNHVHMGISTLVHRMNFTTGEGTGEGKPEKAEKAAEAGEKGLKRTGEAGQTRGRRAEKANKATETGEKGTKKAGDVLKSEERSPQETDNPEKSAEGKAKEQSGFPGRILRAAASFEKADRGQRNRVQEQPEGTVLYGNGFPFVSAVSLGFLAEKYPEGELTYVAEGGALRRDLVSLIPHSGNQTETGLPDRENSALSALRPVENGKPGTEMGAGNPKKLGQSPSDVLAFRLFDRLSGSVREKVQQAIAGEFPAAEKGGPETVNLEKLWEQSDRPSKEQFLNIVDRTLQHVMGAHAEKKDNQKRIGGAVPGNDKRLGGEPLRGTEREQRTSMASMADTFRTETLARLAARVREEFRAEGNGTERNPGFPSEESYISGLRDRDSMVYGPKDPGAAEPDFPFGAANPLGFLAGKLPKGEATHGMKGEPYDAEGEMPKRDLVSLIHHSGNQTETGLSDQENPAVSILRPVSNRKPDAEMTSGNPKITGQSPSDVLAFRLFDRLSGPVRAKIQQAIAGEFPDVKKGGPESVNLERLWEQSDRPSKERFLNIVDRTLQYAAGSPAEGRESAAAAVIHTSTVDSQGQKTSLADTFRAETLTWLAARVGEEFRAEEGGAERNQDIPSEEPYVPFGEPYAPLGEPYVPGLRGQGSLVYASKEPRTAEPDFPYGAVKPLGFLAEKLPKGEPTYGMKGQSYGAEGEMPKRDLVSLIHHSGNQTETGLSDRKNSAVSILRPANNRRPAAKMTSGTPEKSVQSPSDVLAFRLLGRLSEPVRAKIQQAIAGEFPAAKKGGPETVNLEKFWEQSDRPAREEFLNIVDRTLQYTVHYPAEGRESSVAGGVSTPAVNSREASGFKYMGPKMHRKGEAANDERPVGELLRGSGREQMVSFPDTLRRETLSWLSAGAGEEFPVKEQEGAERNFDFPSEELYVPGLRERGSMVYVSKEPHTAGRQDQEQVKRNQAISELETRITRQEYVIRQDQMDLEELQRKLKTQERQIKITQDHEKSAKNNRRLSREVTEKIKEQLRLERIRYGAD